MKSLRYLIIVIASLACIPHAALAAVTVQWSGQGNLVGTKAPFVLAADISSRQAINTISIVMDIPASLDLVDFSDGDSIVNFWIDKPALNATHQIVFSGIIPGGFSGTEGRLITLRLKAHTEGPASISLNPTSYAYGNSTNGTSQPITSEPFMFTVSASHDALENDIPDTLPPEPFIPVLFQTPTDKGEVWAATFQAQDKESGIAGYSVAESWSAHAPDGQGNVSGLIWHEAQNPYVLSDQSLSSYIYVKAVDKKGNIRLEMIAPKNNSVWHLSLIGYILIVIVSLLLVYALISILHKRRGQ